MNIINPIAQSFYIEQESGIYVTSIDLYFSKKDEYLPVTVQLRPMEYGYPSKKVYPFSEVVLSPSDVNTSFDSTLPTRVTFSSPVYLEGRKFHSIAILSNSSEYKVYVSELGSSNIYDETDTTQFPTIVTKQPLSGGLFKSQNSTTWNEQPLEDLKFTLYRANFTSSSGNVTFYSPELSVGNNQIATLLNNSLEMNSRKIKVSTSSTIQDSNLIIGNTIYQNGSNSYGNYVGAAGSASGQLGLINSGIGYTPSSGSITYNNVDLITLTGEGQNATANVTISNGVAIAATVSNGGSGYSVGDVLTAEVGTGLGRNLKLSLSNVSVVNELIIDDVQGEFKVGAGYTLQYINGSGSYVDINSGISTYVYIPTDGIRVVNDGLHIKVNHKNHGMHSNTDLVTISEAYSDIQPTRLSSDFLINSGTEIFVESGTVSEFSSFENVGVSSINPGYVIIDNEIISYEGLTSNSLIGVSRGIDNTPVSDHLQNSYVYKYELNGISLRRINKTHNLSEVSVQTPLGLDYYNIKIDASNDGNILDLPYGQVDRTIDTTNPKLFTAESKSAGGSRIKATQNIQFTLVRPIVEKSVVAGTSLKSSLRTFTGKSIDGNESPYSDNGFENINLDKNNYFNSPRSVYSKVNETNRLGNYPGSKSLSLNVNLNSASDFVSPAIDLDRVGMILVSNRVNNRISNYAEDGRISSLENDPSAFVYATKTISLEVPASSLKLYLSAYINVYNDLRAFYAIQNDPYDEAVYYPFPGYSNIDSLGQTIDESLNDGTSDTKFVKTDILNDGTDSTLFREYEFTENNIEAFKYFSIKLVGTSTNQSYPPLVKDLRVIALA